MGEMWKIVPNIDTPYAVFACLVAGFVTCYGLWRRHRYVALKDVTDANKRLEMLRELLGQYTPDMSSLTREQKAELVNNQIKTGLTRFKWLVVAGGILFVVVVAATVLVAFRPISATETPKNADEKKGVPVTDDSDLPLARLDNFSGNSLKHQGGTRYMSGSTFRVLNAKPNEPNIAYPVATFDLGKVSKSDIAKVNSVIVNWQTIKRDLALLTESAFDNFKPPITYLAKLATKKNSTEARLTINGELTDGLIHFTESNPIAKCRLEFEGEPGLYLVSVEIEVQEARGGRKTNLKSPNPVLVVIPVDYTP
ncbi:hypothetical protein J8F10_28000 [Gemmata sp. G18]|uniref:Uncharacterized protein n=1 Tax=Gemmata palustris TaxID=2822762 RepID=A0ABS5BZF6_9BACT|nr:hypothetical protein [Gemmata palustris]MBP3959106.1 hypothetical protein [Gemmata palustris]